MKIAINALFLATAVAAVTPMAEAQSQTLVVESPVKSSKLAQLGGEAMYLQHTGDGQAILYIETNGGQQLSILNVTDPAKVKDVGRIAIGAPAPFDFVQNEDESSVFIRYRDHSGLAMLNLRKYKHPLLVQTSNMPLADNVEELGTTGILVSTVATTAPYKDSEPPAHEILLTSISSHPVSPIKVEGVVQSLIREETGTLFLLSNKSLTVVRSPKDEEKYQIQQMQSQVN
jgi:hypothetical protein